MQAIHRWLLLVLIASLGARLAWVLTRPADPRLLAQLPDQREYLASGQNFLAGNGLKFVDPRFGQTVYAFRTPGYPAFIAACGGSIQNVRVAQAVLDTFTVLATFLLARIWLGPGASLLAAAIVAFNPFLIYFTGLILTETLFTAMLTWGLLLLVARRGKFWIWGGVILALAALVRPGAIGLPILLGTLAAIINGSARHPYQRWPIAGAVMLLLTILALLPWAWRNDRVLGQWIWTDTNAGFTAYDGFNPKATGASDQNFVQTMPQLRQMTEIQRSGYFATRARRFIASHPIQSADLASVKLLRTWSPQPLSAEFARPAYVIAAWVYDAPFYLLVLIGIGCGVGSRPAKLLLLGPAIYLSIAAMLSVGSLRYRIPALVPMAILAAAGAAAPLANRRSEIPASTAADVPELKPER